MVYPVYPELIAGNSVIEPLMVGGYQVGVVVPASKCVPRPDSKCLQMNKIKLVCSLQSDSAQNIALILSLETEYNDLSHLCPHYVLLQDPTHL